MALEKGSLSIESENMFPIIKKWLYSDHDIFIRELISNGCDAITKRKKLDAMGEATLPDGFKPEIKVIVNTTEKTLSFVDNGIGMTFDEVKEYINQVAFSGATDFLEKYKDKDNADQIIGHFGLGFYSAFMVAESVSIETLSYKGDAEPVHWESEGGIDFTMDKGVRDEVGTTITLFMAEDSLEFANEYRVKEVLEKYCSFMPVEIFVEKEDGEPKYETIDEADLRDDDTVVEYITEPAKTEEKENEDGTKETVEISPEKKKVKINARPVSVSDTNPLWMCHPNECSDEDYKDFYRKVFKDYREPLFWIHLNMDYPFNLKGILYFPKVNTQYDNLEGVIKLYNSQVFIADNIKEVIPEFLMLLKGVIDCPDLPLNVSRSALQNDGFVKKISDYITKKVADKLSGMYKTKKEDYEKYWDDISPFIKFGCLKDDKFREKMKEFIIFKDLDNNYITLPEYVEADGKLIEKSEETEETEDKKDDTAAETTAENKDADDTDKEESAENATFTVYYVNDLTQQGQYVNMFREQKQNALILSHTIDQPFISQLEQSEIEVGSDKKKYNVKFVRVDSEITEESVAEADEEEIKAMQEKLSEIFKKALGKENLNVTVKSFKDEEISSMLTVSEETRRMQDMMKMYSMGDTAGMDDMFGSSGDLVLNSNNKLVKYIIDNPEAENVNMFCEQLYDLAVIANRPLSAEAMQKFISRSNKILGELL